MTSDIFLKQHRIEAVTTNDASLDVATGEDATPDIRLSPNSASLRLGGGDGDYSDGDIRLMDRPDDGESEPRIHLSGGRGNTHHGTRVRVNGKQGFVKLGTPSVENPDVELLSDNGELRLGGGEGATAGEANLYDGTDNLRIRMDTFEGVVRLFDYGDEGAETVTIESSAGKPKFSNAGAIRLSDSEGRETVSIQSNPEDDWGSTLSMRSQSGPETILLESNPLHASSAADGGKITLSTVGEKPRTTVTLAANPNGGSLSLAPQNGKETVSLQSTSHSGGGTIQLRNADDVPTREVVLESSPGDHDGGVVTVLEPGESPRVSIQADGGTNGGGATTLKDTTGLRTVLLDADDGRITLGRFDSGGGVQAPRGQTGTLSLDDGQGEILDLAAESGAVTLGPRDGGAGATELELRPADDVFRLMNGVFSVVENDSDRVSVNGTGGSDDGSAVTLRDATAFRTVSLDGGDGRIKLGETEASNPTRAPRAQNGTLSLDDGAGMVTDLAADSGSVTLGHRDASQGEIGLELRPEDGVFSVVDGDGDPVFRIDTQAKTIEKGKKYKRGVIGGGSNNRGGNGNGPP